MRAMYTPERVQRQFKFQNSQLEKHLKSREKKSGEFNVNGEMILRYDS